MPRNKLSLVIIGLALSACNTTQPAFDSHSPNFGNAIANNIGAQRVAPTAADKANTFIPPNQARQTAARDAYEAGTVKEPSSVVTTE